MIEQPGPVILFGSGETSPSGRKVDEWLLSRVPQPVRVAVLETPAGFELNSARVAGRVADFLREHLQNFSPQVTLVPARKRGTPFSPDDPAILGPLLRANVIFLGPGSPTYAVRQLKDSLAWGYLVARHRLGAALILASAATVAASVQTLPVYEIYKVGEELHWCPGLHLFGSYGLSLVFVPHWNNSEGGAELDTSRCYMGRARFEQLLALLPPGVTVVGIEEHTALVLDFGDQLSRVMGQGGVTLLREGRETRFASGQTFPLTDLGPFRQPAPVEAVPREAWEAVLAAAGAPEGAPTPPAKVLTLTEQRERARAGREWTTADALRERIAALGWQVADTPDGPRLSPARPTRPTLKTGGAFSGD